MLILPQSLKPFLLVECCLTLLLISVSKTSAQEHLVPEWDSFGLRNEYNEKIRQLFESKIGDTELLKIYEKGQIFSLDRDGNRTPGVKTQAYQELKRRTPTDFRDIPVERMKRRLPKQTVDQIAEIWKTMLRGTRYPEKARFGKDGTTYYFAMRDSIGVFMTGMAWSPNESTRTDQLVQLAETLKEYVKSKQTEDQLNAMVRTTQLRLGK